MNRIFFSLAIVALTLMAATLLLGLSLRMVDVRDAADLDGQRWATVHRLSGIATGVLILLVNSIVVTYFIGTSRWCREVSDAYSLGPSLAAESARLKRRTFPWALMSMLVMVGVVALGGAADPAASLQLQPVWGLTWGHIHFGGAALGLCFLAWAFLTAGQNIEANQRVIQQVLVEVKRVRVARGLDTADEASTVGAAGK